MDAPELILHQSRIVYEYAPARNPGPAVVGGNVFCSIIDSAPTGAKLRIMHRRGAGDWIDVPGVPDGLSTTNYMTLFTEGSYLYGGYSEHILKLDSLGNLEGDLLGPDLGFFANFHLATVGGQHGVLHEAAGAVNLWKSSAGDIEVFPGAKFPVGMSLSGSTLRMAAFIQQSYGQLLQGIWYRTYSGSELGALHTAYETAGTLHLAACNSFQVASDGTIYIPFIENVADWPWDRHVFVLVGHTGSPESWEVVDLGILAGSYNFPTIVSALGGDRKTLHVFWMYQDYDPPFTHRCWGSSGQGATFSAPGVVVSTSDFPVKQEGSEVLEVSGAAFVGDQIGLLFSVGDSDGWHSFYYEVPGEEPVADSGCRYRGRVV